jgi:tetratricopeptide (TPR) repeat protein
MKLTNRLLSITVPQSLFLSIPLSLILSLLFLSSCRQTPQSVGGKVKIWEETVTIPTYLIGAPEANPIFYTPENYQGAQRRIYPYPDINKLTDKKADKTYKGLFLENEYIRLCVLPEIGGRLYFALDKTNGYNFIYHNNVIKPALIGMAGAWISGGIEWNIPHHHRVSTFMPVDYKLEENPDGSKTIWVGEYEKRHQTKWEAGLTLYPGKAYVQTDVRLFNVTPVVKSFLIWANPAVHANENYQVIFPPDVEKAVFHSKVEFTDWPISTQYYRGIDFTDSVDVSWWKNTSSPTSFFAWGTEKDFLGGIDHGKNAGIIFVGDHHIFPGKKMWNWGNNEVARLWDQMLTDEDGPYLELMIGSYSDNQPDYSWNNPYSARYGTFYFYPVKGLTGIKEADKDLAVNLDIKNDTAMIQLYSSATAKKMKLVLTDHNNAIIETIVKSDPKNPVLIKKYLEGDISEKDLGLVILNSENKELLRYSPPTRKNLPHPSTYTAPPDPASIGDIEDLYLAGLRLKQFGNPELDPFKYWEEALKRDSDNIFVNTQMGIEMIEAYNYGAAETYLRKVTDKVSQNYTSPKFGESSYYLGISLMRQGKYKDAYDILYRATWNDEWTSPAYYLLSVVDCRNGNFSQALMHIQRAIDANTFNLEAQQLKTVILRQLGKYEEALAQLELLQKMDPLNFITVFEKYILESRSDKSKEIIFKLLRNEPDNFLEAAGRYADAGLYNNALELLNLASGSGDPKLNAFPMIWYYLGCYYNLSGDKQKSEESYRKASDLSPDYCFPYGYESEKVLQDAIAENPERANSYYYLGNLYCDFQPEKALDLWRTAIRYDNRSAVLYRNIAFVESNILDQMDSAIVHLRKAAELNNEDPLYLEELDRCLAYTGTSPEERLKVFQDHRPTVEKSDGAMARYISLLNLNARYSEALDILTTRHFHSAEASDINLHVQWTDAHILRGLELLGIGRETTATRSLSYGDETISDPDSIISERLLSREPLNPAVKVKNRALAIEDFTLAMNFPVNLESVRDGKIAVALYFRGLARQEAGDTTGARQDFLKLINFENVMGWGTGSWPEADLCKALALKKLRRNNEARELLNNLITSGKEMTDYKPNPAADLSSVKQRQDLIQIRAQGYYRQALGYLGLGNRGSAGLMAGRALKLNPSDIGALKYFNGFVEEIP